MPVLSKDEALELLTDEVQQKFDAAELQEVYDEVFFGRPQRDQRAAEDRRAMIERLVGHINSGLEIDELPDLWG